MKALETMNIFVVAAAMTVGVSSSSSSSSSSIPFAENDGNAFLNRDLISDECCRSCEIKQDVLGPTMSSAMQIPVEDEGNANRKTQSDFKSNNDYEDYGTDESSHSVIKILTWDQPKNTLRAYADFYRATHPEAPTIRIESVPSLQDLDYEVTNELQIPSTAFDGFVVPPAFMGGMYKQRGGQALAVWTPQEDTNTSSSIEDLLPYYRYGVATFDGKIRGLPILAGSQAMILFRKDYLDALNLPTPKTWEHWTALAATISNAVPPLLGDGSQPVYGACMGLLSEDACRKRKSLTGQPCRSQSMNYLGMMMASMTQYMGNQTGFMMGIDSNTPTGLDPLFQPTLTRILKWMEDQLKNSRLRSLTEDALDSMENFRAGRCAWTISIDHDSELLNDRSIGFVPLPGSHQVLDRNVASKTGGRIGKFNGPGRRGDLDPMINCTMNCDIKCELLGTSARCPNGKEIEDFGFINHVPFGAVDATVGTVSGRVSESRQEQVKKFFRFVLASDIGEGVSDPYHVHQPLTYSELEKSDIQNYENTMRKLTSNPNVAIPFRAPNAFNLLLDLDDRVYDYLLEGNYSKVRREEVTLSAEKSWQMMIAMYDARGQIKDALPTSYYYKQSCGVHVPVPASDLYIGWTVRGIMWIFAGLSCLTSIGFAVLVWIYERERVIRASQPVFLYLICAGTFIMTLSIFTLGIEDDIIASDELITLACVANYWLYSLGFTAVISALFTKTCMLAKVFSMPRNEQRLQITQGDILVPFLIVFGIDFIVLFIWTTTQEHKWVRGNVHNDDLYSLNMIEKSTQGWCESEGKFWNFALLLMFNYLIVILALVQAYECRRITTEYAESAWITTAIIVFAQGWLIGLPVVMLVHFDPRTYFLLRSLLVLFTSFTVLLLIFVPKTIYLFKALRESEELKNNQETSQEFTSQSFSLQDASASTLSVLSRGKSPKGTIGIRIVESTCLDHNEIDHLKQCVDKAELRNKILRDTREKLKDNLEERRYARSRLFPSNPSLGSSIGVGSIVKAKPDRYRDSRIHGDTVRTYLP